MSDPIITAVTPINIGIIKYFDDPDIRNLYPINDYLTVTLDPSVICAKSSVCAKREFTYDEFWLNGKRDASPLLFCLNEVKYCAASQHTVSIEFLTRKVHVACENNFLPAFGTSSFAAGFTSLMTALCKLYKINPKILRNDSMTPKFLKSLYGGFVQRRNLSDSRNYFEGKLIAEGKHWPDLRVLVLIVKSPREEKSMDHTKGIVKSSEYIDHRLRESLPKNLKAIKKAIQGRDFATFAETMMRDNNQFHSVNIDTYPPRAYKTEISHKIAEVIHVYNKISLEIKAAYVFDTGPNASLFFLKENAQELLSLIKHVFPSSKSSYIQANGMKVPDDLVAGHFRSFPIEPMKRDRIKYAIYTKVGNVSVQIDEENHLLEENGHLITKNVLISPSTEATSSSSKYSDAIDSFHEDLSF